MYKLIRTSASTMTFLSRWIIMKNAPSLLNSPSLMVRSLASRPFQITSLDHLVLTVQDLDKTVDFYTRVLGMEVTTFKGGRKALTFGDQKINLHEYGNEFEPNAETPTPGSADLCFISPTPLGDIASHLKKCEITIIEGPIERTGAVGSILSLYVRDPDGNLIEVSNYTNRIHRFKN